MKSEFISVVSHELRTPLTPIKGYIDLILEGDAGELTDEQSAYLKIVEVNTDRLVALVNDLLDISRIEAGKIDLELKPVAVEEVVQEVVAVHRKQIESRGLNLTRVAASAPALGQSRSEPDHTGAQQSGEQCMQIHAERRHHHFCRSRR